MSVSRAQGARKLAVGQREYPDRLRRIYDPPGVLFVEGRGRWDDAFGSVAVALVGSRDATAYGLAMARSLGRDLAANGVTVVSGLALGIDAAAHAGALEAGGSTVAVVGSGTDIVYPRRNARLRGEILRRGLLVAEWPPGTEPRPWHFPKRNRIISGLSLAVVVVEAGRRSGALVTARLALEQGREVLAVPGPAGAPRSAGPNGLLKTGAGLVETVDDILHALPFGAQRAPAPRKNELSVELAEILESLAAGARTVDEMVTRTNRKTEEIWALLLDLEVRGLVQRGPAGRFEKVPGRGPDGPG